MDLPLWLRDGIANYGYWFVLLAVAIESMGIPFPGETALVAAAVYAGTTHSLNIGAVIAAAALGAILGDNTGYEIGRRGGHPLLMRLARLLRIDNRGLVAAERYFVRHGNKTVFAGRFISILRTWVAFVAGVNRMPRRAFFIWNATGGIVWATCYGLLGYLLGDNLPELRRVLEAMGYVGIAVIVLVVLLVGLWFYRRRRILASTDPAHPQPKQVTKQVTTGDDAKKAFSSTTQRAGSLLVGIAAEQAEEHKATKRPQTPPPEPPAPRKPPPAPVG